MPSPRPSAGRRVAVLSAVWCVLVTLAYWPLWYQAQLWWANHRPPPPGAMAMTVLEIWVTPGPADYLLWLLLALLGPAILLRWQARHQRGGPLGGHLT